MSFSVDEINKIAVLARLGISTDQVPEYARNLSDIMKFVEQMDNVDTSGVEPMAHPQDVVQRLRVDQVTEGNQRNVFQSLAPAVEKGLYLVPKVIE